MATKYTKEQLLNKKIIDYTFVITFFLIFSFFIFFAIKPNLETAFKLQRELEELKQIDANYNQAIDTIIKIQSTIEQNRDSLHLLDEALPAKANVNKIVADIQKSASESGFPISRLSVTEIPIVNPVKNPGLTSFHVSFDSQAGFEEIHTFIGSFLAQRRLKLIHQVNFGKAVKEASDSAQLLNVSFQIESYYL